MNLLKVALMACAAVVGGNTATMANAAGTPAKAGRVGDNLIAP